MEVSEVKLKKAEDLYKGWFDDTPFGPYDYSLIYKSFGAVVFKQDIGRWQGDTQILLKNQELDKFGYLMFGWGSCSGCDSLQRCDSYDEIDELIGLLWGQIRWFDDDKEALKFFEEHKWDCDWGYSPTFVEACKTFFSSRLALEAEEKVG